MNYLEDVPNFSAPSRKDNVRPAFSREDWNKLIRHSRHWISRTNHPSVLRDRTMLWNYILILANTGIRVGEARSLRWSDIRTQQNDTPNPTSYFMYQAKRVVAKSYQGTQRCLIISNELNRSMTNRTPTVLFLLTLMENQSGHLRKVFPLFSTMLGSHSIMKGSVEQSTLYGTPMRPSD